MAKRRQYALTKVRAGDYLLPSNDGQVLWRLARDEREGWSVWRFAESLDMAILDHLDDWNYWELDATHLPTREAAIREAMRMSP